MVTALVALKGHWGWTSVVVTAFEAFMGCVGAGSLQWLQHLQCLHVQGIAVGHPWWLQNL